MIASLLRCRETLDKIRRDCESDAAGLDGQPFTGKTVATQFGNVLAMVEALSNVVDEIVGVLDRELPM